MQYNRKRPEQIDPNKQQPEQDSPEQNEPEQVTRTDLSGVMFDDLYRRVGSYQGLEVQAGGSMNSTSYASTPHVRQDGRTQGKGCAGRVKSYPQDKGGHPENRVSGNV